MSLDIYFNHKIAKVCMLSFGYFSNSNVQTHEKVLLVPNVKHILSDYYAKVFVNIDRIIIKISIVHFLMQTTSYWNLGILYLRSPI